MCACFYCLFVFISRYIVTMHRRVSTRLGLELVLLVQRQQSKQRWARVEATEGEEEGEGEGQVAVDIGAGSRQSRQQRRRGGDSHDSYELSVRE